MINLTPQELGKVVKTAKQNGFKIKVYREEHHTVLIIPQKLGSGYGEVCMNLATSHRKMDRMMQIPGARWFCYNYGVRSVSIFVPNTVEALAQARALGATVKRDQQITEFFEVVSKAQQAAKLAHTEQQKQEYEKWFSEQQL